MARHFTAYFTLKGVWRSCDVNDLGTHDTERAAMGAGQQHALQRVVPGTNATPRLVWTRVPQGLVAKTVFGRYDIREIP